MVRSIQVVRVMAIGSIYLSLGTGVFAGCGDPALNSKRSDEQSNVGAQSSQSGGQTQNNAGQEAARAQGLRHSTNDTEHVVLRAAPGEGQAAPDSVALCTDKDYSDERANGQVGASEGDRSAECRTP